MSTNLANTVRLLLMVTTTLLLLSQPAFSQGAKVVGYILATGEGVSAKDGAGKVRALKRRSAVYEGDTVFTGDFAVQIRLTDGSLTSLRPQTEFKIESYHWEGQADGKERGFFSLIKGGLRTITGLIGKKNKKNYQMKTPVATIGIRGTDYGLRLCNGGCPGGLRGLFGGVFGGGIFVVNPGGRGEFDPGSYFRVLNGNSPPERQLGPPPFQFGRRDTGGPQVAGNQEEGEPTILVNGETEIPSPAPHDPVPADPVYTTKYETAMFSFIHGNSSGSYEGVVGTVSSQTYNSETAAVSTVNSDIPSGTFSEVVTNATFADNNGSAKCTSCTFSRLGSSNVKDAAQRTTAEYTVTRGRWRNDGTTTYSLTGTAGAHSGMTGVSVIYSDDVTTESQWDAIGTTHNFSTKYASFRDTVDQNGVVNGNGLQSISFDADFTARSISNYQMEVEVNGINSGPVTQTGAASFSSARESGVSLSGTFCYSCTGTSSVEGRATVEFLGSSASSAMGSYEIHSTDNKHGFVGTYVVDR